MEYNKKQNLAAFLWPFFRKRLGFFLCIQVLALAFAFDQTLWPYVIKLIVDGLQQFEGPRSDIFVGLAYPLAFMAILWVSTSLSFRILGFLKAKEMPHLEASIRMKMFSYVQHHSYQYFSENFSGSIANKISDLPQSVTRMFRLICELFIPALATIIVASLLFASYHSYFAAILLLWVTIHMSIVFFFARVCSDASQKHSESRSLLSGKIVDSLSNNLNVKLFSRLDYEINFLQYFQNDEESKHKKALRLIEKIKVFVDILCFLMAGVFMTWLSLQYWQKGMLSAGDVIFILNTTWNIAFIVWMVGSELPNLFKEFGICRQALTIMGDTHDVSDKQYAHDIDIKRGCIEFRQVDFDYTKNQKLFRQKDIAIKAGQKVGLVGFSGSGKSTFVNLILRFYDLDKGGIYIDNQNIAECTQSSLRGQITMIPQDTVLFHRSLMDNIRYGNPQATDEEVVEASQKAYCHEFISGLEAGYNTLVGERGTKLSGGQRQRIAIARAILKNAPILILDEATSALDSSTEFYIQKSLEKLMENRTTLVVAHRLSTLLTMDRILVFHNGAIVEDGSHNELLQNDGHYAYLWSMQTGGFLPENSDDA